jgi:hypothetical protein
MFAGEWFATGLAGAMASPAQRAAVIRLTGGREMMIVQPTYRGPGRNFAWIVPVPGLPPTGDIQTVSPRLLDYLLEEVDPVIVKRVHEVSEPERGHPGFRHTLAAGKKPLAAPAQVTVHDLLDVGKYRVAVLSATGGTVLQQWLRQNGYGVPQGADQVLGQYVGQGWYFVALKLRAPDAAPEVMTADLEPLALCFPAAKLVYPLTITRLSAAPMLALRLLVVDDQPVSCSGLPMKVPEQVSLPPGQTYGEYLRGLTASGALVREGVTPTFARALAHDTPGLALLAAGRDWKHGFVSGFRGVLPREALQDVYFTPDPECQPYLTEVDQEAWAPLRFWLLELAPGAVVLALLLVWLALAIRRRRRRTAHWAWWVGAALLLAGLGWRYWIIPTRSQCAKIAENNATLVGRQLQVFIIEHGCFPREAAQLENPRGRGQDGAGNSVPLQAEGQVSWKTKVPVDPLTGRTDTWVIDPTAHEFVTSRAWQVSIRTVPVHR